MANQAEDALSQAANWVTGLWGQAQDFLIARENRKATEARADQYASGYGSTAEGTWTNPDAAAAAAVMGGGAGKYQNLMLFLAFAGVAISLLTFIRR